MGLTRQVSWVEVFIPLPGKRFWVTFEIVNVLTWNLAVHSKSYLPSFFKIYCDNWENDVIKNDVLSRWPLCNSGLWTYFFLKLCQLNLVILIQNLGVPFCHLSQVWILQTRLKIRPKSYFDSIARTLNFKFGQKVHLVILVNNFYFWQFLLIPACKILISGWSIPAIPYFKKQKCFWL